MSRATTRRLRLGLRRETLILLPVALLLLVALSIFTLLAFRNALELVAEERRQEAAALARRSAERLAGPAAEEPGDLLAAVPSAAALALVAAGGEVVFRAGDLAVEDLLAPLAGRLPDEPLGLGFDDRLADRAVGFAPAFWRGRRHVLRVDLPAPRLASQRRALRTLSWIVLPVDFAVALLVVFFLRHLLTPFETMLARAREIEPEEAGGDEADYLLSIFERALARLGQPAAASPEDDLGALERALGPSLESGVLLLDREGALLALNPFGAGLLHIPVPEPGAALDAVLAAHPALADVVRRATREARSARREEIEIEAGGERRMLGLTVHPLRRGDGPPRAFLVLFADLTEARRRSEQERLSESLAQVGELAAGIAHEMRNSLAAVRGYLTLIEREGDAQAIADYQDEIRRETDHLQRVLEDFLSFARPGTTRMEALDLERVVRRAAADPLLGATGVELRRSGPEARMQGDGQLLERAVRNLLHNAAEAQRRAGRDEPLEVAIGQHDGELELAIRDRGDGVPPEVRERLFEPFATSGHGGVGLGLALARRIVDLHGGTLQLDDREGGGCAAIVRFRAGDSVTKSN